jgi:hypothetical protein
MLFHEPLVQLAEYIRRGLVDRPGLDEHVAQELIARLRQLSWLYDKATELEDRVMHRYAQLKGPIAPGTSAVIVFHTNEAIANPKTEFTLPEQLSVFAEAFYETAFRVLTILDQCGSALPGLAPIKATGVRRVRNNLFVHANKPFGTTIYTFSVSNTAGVRLRPASKVDEPTPYMDEGLRVNAAELSAELSTLFRVVNAA